MKVSKTYRLEEYVLQKIDEIAKKNNMTATKVIEYAIIKWAEEDKK